MNLAEAESVILDIHIDGGQRDWVVVASLQARVGLHTIVGHCMVDIVGT
jgi:hypothetical protein